MPFHMRTSVHFSTSFLAMFSSPEIKPSERSRLSQREDVQDGRVALVLQLRRVYEPAPGARVLSCGDRHELLAARRKRHRWCGEARPHIDLPQLLECGVVVG